MVHKIILDPTANLDITESIDWYNKAQPGVGLKFYKQVQAVMKSIRKNPFAFRVRYNTSRTATLKNFPFLLHYIIDSERKVIVVTSVLHTSRDPKLWDGRKKF